MRCAVSNKQFQTSKKTIMERKLAGNMVLKAKTIIFESRYFQVSRLLPIKHNKSVCGCSFGTFTEFNFQIIRNNGSITIALAYFHFLPVLSQANFVTKWFAANVTSEGLFATWPPDICKKTTQKCKVNSIFTHKVIVEGKTYVAQ